MVDGSVLRKAEISGIMSLNPVTLPLKKKVQLTLEQWGGG